MNKVISFEFLSFSIAMWFLNRYVSLSPNLKGVANLSNYKVSWQLNGRFQAASSVFLLGSYYIWRQGLQGLCWHFYHQDSFLSHVLVKCISCFSFFFLCDQCRFLNFHPCLHCIWDPGYNKQLMCMMPGLFCSLYSLNIMIDLLRGEKKAYLSCSTASVNVETEEYQSETNYLSPG